MSFLWATSALEVQGRTTVLRLGETSGHEAKKLAASVPLNFVGGGMGLRDVV